MLMSHNTSTGQILNEFSRIFILTNIHNAFILNHTKKYETSTGINYCREQEKGWDAYVALGFDHIKLHQHINLLLDSHGHLMKVNAF